jgi:hypothetical protein
VNLDDVLKKLSAKPKLDQKESSDGLWETSEQDLFNFLKDNIANGFPYPIFCSSVGGNIYLYFTTTDYKLPLSIRVENHAQFVNSINAMYLQVVTRATI